MAAGLDACRVDALILLDADLQDPPELIPQLIEEWENGYDDVYAKRTSRQGETFLKKFTSKLYYRLLSRLSRVPIQVDTGDFRLLDRRVVEALCSLRESGRCSKSLFSWVGFRKKEVPFERAPRHAGKTKWNYGSLCSLALDGITGLTTFPLRLPLFIGIGLLLLSGFYLLALPIISLLGHDLPASLVASHGLGLHLLPVIAVDEVEGAALSIHGQARQVLPEDAKETELGTAES